MGIDMFALRGCPTALSRAHNYSLPPDATRPARILALDVGARRIGVAVSDELGLTAQGLATIERHNRSVDLDALRNLAREHSAALWLIGLPRHLSGREGRQAEQVRHWGEALAAHTRLRVEYWDERLTTVEAGRILRAASASRLQTKNAIDRISAVILLQSYLDAMRSDILDR